MHCLFHIATAKWTFLLVFVSENNIFDLKVSSCIFFLVIYAQTWALFDITSWFSKPNSTLGSLLTIKLGQNQRKKPHELAFIVNHRKKRLDINGCKILKLKCLEIGLWKHLGTYLAWKISKRFTCILFDLTKIQLENV